MARIYNGIDLPEAWPPRGMDNHSLTDLPVPYLRNPPEVVDITVGRQLFIDNFLIEETTMEQRFYSADFQPAPVIVPETPLEMSHGIAPMAAPFTDGCWYDPLDGLYKMWYHSGWMDATCMAVSQDGRTWVRKMLDNEPGTNMTYKPPKGWRRDGSTIWLDNEAKDPRERWKMYTFYRTPDQGDVAEVQVSGDGLHWGEPSRIGQCGDNTSFFFNPFRQKWVFSIRKGMPLFQRYSRARHYYECDDFMAQSCWKEGEDVFWQRCDETDLRECEAGVRYSPLMPPQLYHLNCVAYESVMLGLFGIIKGFDEFDNHICENTGRVKHIDLHAAFSRDGFHFSRENRLPFMQASGNPGDWNCGYLHACGGLCLVDGDQLLFPVGGFSCQSTIYGGHIYGGGSTGFATLRRDGFASMRSNWSRQYTTTRPVVFTEGRCLFVNANALEGFVGVEILDVDGNVLPGFSLADCVPAQGDFTKQQIRFIGGHDLSELQGKPVRFRFHGCKGDLYSFWVSEDERGASGGYVAAGGPGFEGNRDL